MYPKLEASEPFLATTIQMGPPARPDQPAQELSQKSTGPVFRKPLPDSKIEDRLIVNPRTIYAVLILIAVTFLFNLGIDEYRDHGRVTILNWPLIASYFQLEHVVNVFALWGVCNACIFVACGGFQVWRKGRTALNKIGAGALWNHGWMTAAVLLHTAMLVVTSWAAYRLELPVPAISALCYEQVRLLMKSIAYLKVHVKAALELRESNDSMVHLAYFLFAPTLKYKDHYERTPRMRWGLAAAHFAMFLFSTFTMVVAISRGALRPFCGGPDGVFLDASPLRGGPRFALQLLIVILRCWPIGAVILVSLAVGLHSWHMAWAAVLRYPLQGFTQPWWNSTSYAGFFHHWNTFVKGWLHLHVFKELLARGYSTNIAKLITICVSAIWHEYILATSLGFCIPWFAVFYSLSAVVAIYDPIRLQKGTRGNLFLVLSIGIGVGIAVSFYIIESAARKQCPRTMDLPWDVFVPRIMTCDQPFTNCTTI